MRLGTCTTSCQHVDLSSRGITSLSSGVFDGITSLETLNIRANALTEVPTGSFDSLTELKHLNLGENGLTGLDVDLFNHNSKLVGLDLQYNSIATLAPGTFDGLTGLKFLQMSYNKFAPRPFYGGLPYNLLQQSTSLSHLYLSANSDLGCYPPSSAGVLYAESGVGGCTCADSPRFCVWSEPSATYAAGDELLYQVSGINTNNQRNLWEAPAVVFPSSEDDITQSTVLWERGGRWVGAWLGIKREDTGLWAFRLRAGNAKSSFNLFSGGADDCAVVDYTPDSSLLDGKAHHVMWEIQNSDVSEGEPLEVSLYIDGELVGSSSKDTGKDQKWAGNNAGSWGKYSNIGSDVPDGEAEMPDGEWEATFGEVGSLNLHVASTVAQECPQQTC